MQDTEEFYCIFSSILTSSRILLTFQSYDNCFIANTAFSLLIFFTPINLWTQICSRAIYCCCYNWIYILHDIFFYSLCKWPHTLTAISLFRYWIWMHSWVRARCNASWLSRRPKFQFHSSEHAEYLTEHSWFNEYSCSNLALSAQLK